MDAVADFINTLDGMSLFIGLAMGLAVGLIFALLTRPNIKKTFSGLAVEALKESSEELTKSNESLLHRLEDKSRFQTEQHSAEFENKKELIDQRLTEMDKKLGAVQTFISEFENARENQFGALDKQLQNLTQTTTSLQRALADNRVRGQWGERIAEDILQLLGFIKDVNYKKQSRISSERRPDFTFLLPNQMYLNMDAKFPLVNYQRYFDADTESVKKRYRAIFLRDVKNRISEIQGRGYINSKTVNCVLIFIPNEQIYRFIHEQDHSIIEFALKQRVILCSPLTLYIVLSVIHQAAENFAFEQKSREIFGVIKEIQSEWEKYTDQMAKLEASFRTLQGRFNTLTGTRTRRLDSKFNRIESITKDNRPRLDNKGSSNYQRWPPTADDIPF